VVVDQHCRDDHEPSSPDLRRAWDERALALGREIGPLAQAETRLIKADTLLKAGRHQEAERALGASENAIGELRSEIRALLAARVAGNAAPW
jgi:hypothetical protein